MIATKRVYDPVSPADGYRILVDRLWPRGVSKSEAALDEWLKDVAPSDELRKWFGHRPERFAEFREKYRAELQQNVAFDQLKAISKAHPTITLLYAARDLKYNQAAVLHELLTKSD